MMRPPDALKSVASRAPVRLLPAGVAFPDAMATFRFNLVPNIFSSWLRPAVRRTGKWSGGGETQERSRSETTVGEPQAEARRLFGAT